MRAERGGGSHHLAPRAVAAAALFLVLGCASEPGTSKDFFRRAMTHYEDGEYETAIQDLSMALILKEDVLARYLRASCYSLLEDDRKCLSDIETILHASPEFDYALLVRAHTLERMGCLQAALDAFVRFLEADPESPHAAGVERRIFLLEVKIREEGPGPQAPDLLPPHLRARDLFTRGLEEMAKGDWRTAYAAFTRALRVMPDHYPALQHRADVLIRMGRAEEASRDLAKVLDLKPALAIGHYLAGIAFEMQGKLSEAAERYRSYLRYRPGAVDTVALQERIALLEAEKRPARSLPLPDLPENRAGEGKEAFRPPDE